MELLSYYHAHDILGRVDGRDETPACELYLLDRRFTVLEAYPWREGISRGDSFFELYPASRAVQNEAYTYLQGFRCNNFLLPTRGGAVLVIGGLCASCGLLPVVVPPQGLREVFDHPADLYGLLPGLSVSARLLPHSKRHSMAALRLATEWYHRVYRAFSFGEGTQGEAMLYAMYVRIRRLAELTGCLAEFDLRGIGEPSARDVEWDWYTGALLVAMLSASRSPSRELSLYVERAHPGDAVLHITLPITQGELPALAPMRRCAALRGITLEYFPQGEGLHLRLSLRRAALEEQDVKERHPLVSRALQKRNEDAARPIPTACREQACELRFDEEREG